MGSSLIKTSETNTRLDRHTVMSAQVPRPGRNFLRFSLRTLLVGMVVCGIVLGFAARVHSRAQRQKQILVATAKARGNIRYDFECYSESPWYAAQRWLAPKIGADYVGNVQILNFAGTAATDWRKPLAAATELQSIEYFSACCQGLEPSDIDHLGKLSRLKELHLHHHRDLPALQPLAGLQHLELLGLQVRGVTSEKLAGLERLPKLKILDLCRSDAADEIVPLLAAFPALEELHAEASKITATGLAGLSKSKSLRVLHVDDTQVSVQKDLPGVTVCLK